MKRQRLKKTIFVGVISTIIALSSIGTFAVNKSPIARLLIRDAVVATVAHQKAGEKILLDSDEDISSWLLEYSQIIVPFFEQENIRETPIYPKEIIVELKEARKGVSISGLAFHEDRKIYIFLCGEEQVDPCELLPVLVHEQIHLQWGRFIGSGETTWNVVAFEGNTQAATAEVLAAMCYSGDNLACAAFWTEIENYASGTFWTRLQQTELAERYQVIATLLWSGGPDYQNLPVESIQIYLHYPWEQIIVPGIMGKSLDTGNMVEYEISDGNFVCRTLFMPFDDVEDLLGWLDQFIEWITPEGD